MTDYETRLVASLRSHGADDRVVDEARAFLRDFSADDDLLLQEFGEPEDYARALVPGGQQRPKVAFILTGVILAIIAWLTLRWADDTNQGWSDGLGLAQYLLPLMLLAAGILLEFLRYLRKGRR